MLKVKNGKILSVLAKRTMKANKYKVTIFAIALTSILFTSIFTIGGSIIQSSEAQTMRQVGGSAHAGYKYFTQEEYDTVAKDSKIKDISYSRCLGTVDNEGFDKNYTEVRYSEDKSAKWSFIMPTQGHMPKEENEVATSTIVLDTLNLPYELGETIHLKLLIHGKIVEQSFTLCGYWEGDIINHAQEVLVSKAYADKTVPIPTKKYKESDVYDITGYISADIFFSNSLNIEKQMNDLSARCGFDPDTTEVGINWAYSSATIDMQTMVLAGCILIIIMLSGYLIIYNIFYINVYRDIQFYGLLKTLGTTGKQLRRIVYKQAFTLCIYGIPLGLVGGWVLGKFLVPVVMSILSSAKYQQVSVHPAIFIAAILFTLFTVYLSCLRPCRIVAKVSPMEAVHYTAGGDKERMDENRKKLSGKQITQKKTRHVTPMQMAIQNLKRQKKQVFVVVLSLSLSMILLNSVYSIVSGFDMDKYLKENIISDFDVCDATIMNPAVYDKVYDGVDEEFLNQLSKYPVENVGKIYGRMCNHEFDDADYERIKQRVLENPELSEYFGKDQYLKYLHEIEDLNLVDGFTYGLNDYALSKLEVLAGTIDVEKLKTGKYIIISASKPVNEVQKNYFEPGEKVQIKNSEGEFIEYEIMAVVELPDAISPHLSPLINFEVFLPENIYLTLYPDSAPMHTFFDVADTQEEEVNQWLVSYCETGNLTYNSKGTVVEELKSLTSTYAVVGGALSFVLAVIGILNFTNSIMTSLLVRKKELSMMEAIGMTGRQLCQMLSWEGIDYALLTIIISMTVGIGICFFIVQAIAGFITFFTWHFTIVPILLCIPFLLAISILVPMVSYRQMTKQSVVERMRV